MFTYRQKSYDVGDFDRIPECNPAEQSDNSHARMRYRKFLSSAIRYLPPKHREVITLYYLEGLKMPQIAQTLSISKSTVSRRIAASKKILQELARMCENAGFFLY